jgi:hypothetical protein
VETREELGKRLGSSNLLPPVNKHRILLDRALGEQSSDVATLTKQQHMGEDFFFLICLEG